MTSRRGKRSKKSICEKSMNIMVNIVKVSSLSIAKMSLVYVAGTPPPSSTIEVPGQAHDSGTKKLVEPEKEKKRSSYLMEPEDDDINWRAVQYINGVRKRNIAESKKMGAGSDYILLPPPPFRPRR